VKRRIILSLCAATVLGLALLPDAAVSQQKSLTEQLVGSWTIISNDNVAPDGTKRQILVQIRREFSFSVLMEATHLLSSTRHVQNLWANPDWTARQRKTSQPLRERSHRLALGRSTKRPTPSSRALRAISSRMMKAGTNAASSHWKAINSKWSIHLRAPAAEQKSCSDVRSSTRRRHWALYSITSSARARSVGGTVSPSALAVLRLIASSYLVGACTARFAGFSPLRMRST
jgi:hypothetical protein